MSIIAKASAIARCAMLEKLLVKKAFERYSFIFLCGVLSMLIVARFAQNAPVPETVKAEIIVQETPVEQIRFVNNYDGEARSIAKVLYGTALDKSPEQQKAVVWCVLNRVESSIYPDNVKDVCAQESQWMGYSDDNPVIQDLYDLAIEQLNIWHSSDIRPMSNDFVFLTWRSDGIELRTTFNKTNTTRYWIVK